MTKSDKIRVENHIHLESAVNSISQVKSGYGVSEYDKKTVIEILSKSSGILDLVITATVNGVDG